MQQAAMRLIAGFPVIGSVLGVIFAINAANESEWIGAGVCLVGSAAAALVARRTLEGSFGPSSI